MVFVIPVGDGQQGIFSSCGGDESLSVCPHIPVYQPTHTSQSTHTRQRILRRKATGAVPYTLLYIAFSGAFQRLLPRLLY